jgi:hypothetical protein
MPPAEDDEVEEDELWLPTLWLSSFDIIILFKSLGGGLTGSVFEKDLDLNSIRLIPTLNFVTFIWHTNEFHQFLFFIS